MNVSTRQARKLVEGAAVNLLVVLLLILFLFPILWIVTTAFKTRSDAFTMPPVFLFTPTLKNFIDAFGPDSVFPLSATNSLLVATSSSVLALVLGVPAAYALSRFKIGHKSDILFWILSTRMLPPVGMAVPLFLIVSQLGLVDNIWVVLVLYLTFNLSFAVWMMKGFFDDLPLEVEESALMDGCTPLQSLWHISIPLSRPALATTLIFCFIFAWNEFLMAFVMTRAYSKTAPLAIMEGVGMIEIRWEYMSAMAVMAMIPPLLFAFLARRNLVSGLTLGAIK